MLFILFLTYDIVVTSVKLWKESLNSDGQQFHQY